MVRTAGNAGGAVKFLPPNMLMDWAYDRRITIDTGVFLNVETVKAIVDLKFNPGEGVAHLNSAAWASLFWHAVCGLQGRSNASRNGRRR